jgi:hypothetical protein
MNNVLAVRIESTYRPEHVRGKDPVTGRNAPAETNFAERFISTVDLDP